MYVHMSLRLQTNMYMGKSQGCINIRSIAVQNKKKVEWHMVFLRNRIK